MENRKVSFGKKLLMGERTSLYIALIAMLTFFAVKIPTFFAPANILAILTSAVTMGLVAIGESYLIIAGQIDLSAGAVAAFAGIFSGTLLNSGMNLYLTFLLTFVVGALWGIVSGLLVTELKFQPFIATFAVQSMARGFAYVLTDAKSVNISHPGFIAMTSSSFFGIKAPVWILIILLILFSLILKFTSFGRSVYALGGNPVASRLAGIKSKSTLLSLFALSSVLATLGGMILSSRMHSAVASNCANLEMDGLTAAVLGGISFAGGSGNMVGTILGIFILQGFNNGLQVMGLSTYWQYVAKGALLILALAFDGIRTRIMSKSK